MEKIADLIAGLMDATVARRLNWVRQDTGGYRVDLAGVQVLLSGDPTPAALEAYLRSSTLGAFMSIVGRQLVEIPKICLAKGQQPQPNWPARRLTLANPDGKVVLCFEADREHVHYNGLALLFLEAFAAAEAGPASLMIESLLAELRLNTPPAGEARELNQAPQQTPVAGPDAWAPVDAIYHRLATSGQTFSDSADQLREDRNR